MINAIEILAYLAIALPAAGFVVNGLVLRWLTPARLGGGSDSRWASYVGVATIGAAFVLSLITLFHIVQNGAVESSVFNWIALPGLELRFGLILDPLTGLMLTLVSGISLLVQLYAIYYMREQGADQPNKNYARFFAFMALFTASMLGLVSARNLVQVFIFWELVGLCSYFLIVFWANRPSAVAAARKAFLMTRLGDFGFLLAMMYIAFNNPAWLEIPELYGAIHAGLISAAVASWIVIGLLAAVVGKSAQLPLHAWLADAMEGPTPVSALLHSATMVTAGVFLVARVFPLFELSNLQPLVAIIGIATALIAATMGMASNDIKRVLAFSTISQIGYMVFALGIGAYGAAIFHLFVHAFFKAGLFMVAGRVGHITHSFDMRVMGGVRKSQPFLYGVAVICGLSLAALFPLSGFWSKDEIVVAGFENGWAIGSVLLLAVSVITAFYTFRMIYLTFHGESRGADAAHSHRSEAETQAATNGGAARGRLTGFLRGEPLLSLAPLALLAGGAIVLGYLINPVGVSLGPIAKHSFSSFITHNPAVFPTPEAVIAAGGEPHFSWIVAFLSIGSALFGLLAATLIYGRGRVRFGLMQTAPFKHASKLFTRQYYFNELYETWIADRLFLKSLAKLVERFEIYIVDEFGDRLAAATQIVGAAVRRVQAGSVQLYASVMFLGAAAAFVIYLAILMFG